MNFSRVFDYWNLIVNGIGITLLITFGSLAGGFLLSLPLAMIKVSKNKLLRGIGFVYTDFFRGVPALVQIYLAYFALPQMLGITFNVYQASLLTLSMNSAAYMSEALRGGIESIDIGQREAAKSLGVPYINTMLHIILPQAFKNVMPAIANEAISLLKGTSLVSIIGVVDLMRVGRQIMADTYLTAEPLLIVAVIYYFMVKILTIVTDKLEYRIRVSDRR